MSSFALSALVVTLGVSSAACGGGGGGGRRDANGPSDARGPNGNGNGRGNDGNGRGNDGNRNDGSRGDERRDDAKDKKREENTRWEKLGERMVDGKGDRDAIAVSRQDGKFQAIQIKVEASALELDDMRVTFGDGSTFEPKTKLTFGNGASTRVIDLPGEKRNIKRVDFRYGNLPGGGRAQVELWAR